MNRRLRSLFFFVLGVCLNGSLNAQGYAASIGFSGGYAEDGLGANVSFNHHLNRYSFVQVALFGASGTERFGSLDIPYQIVAIQPGYFKRIALIDVKRPIGAYIGGGVLGGYELLNNGENILETGAVLEANSKFIYGGFIGVEIEYPFTEEISVSFKATEHFHINSDIGKIYPFVGLGMRFYLY